MLCPESPPTRRVTGSGGGRCGRDAARLAAPGACHGRPWRLRPQPGVSTRGQRRDTSERQRLSAARQNWRAHMSRYVLPAARHHLGKRSSAQVDASQVVVRGMDLPGGGSRRMWRQGVRLRVCDPCGWGFPRAWMLGPWRVAGSASWVRELRCCCSRGPQDAAAEWD
jgi:hypothetical protein